MPNSWKRSRPFLAGLALFFVASGLFAQERWFHVRVNESGSDPTEVAVNLPLSLIEAALRMLPQQVHEEIDLELNDADFDLAQLRQFWQDVKGTDDATFVTVNSPDETVKVSKQGDFLVAKTTERSERGAQVDVRFPFAVLDALFQGTDEHEIDLVGAVRALAQYGDGDIVTVVDGDSRVRVWVDDENEPAI